MSSDSIKVVCRLRPINKIQIANNGQQCVKYSDKEICIKVGQQNKYNFAFDKIFGPQAQQVEVYKEVAIPVIKAVLNGFNGTIFAYGQTGGGKTWTMEGPNHHDAEYRGLIPRTIEGLFQGISESDEHIEYVIKCSYIEIYNEKLFDLLDPSKARLEIKEDKHKGVFIQNCTEISVGSSEQMLKTMDNGSSNRKVAFTGMNQRSSRSHSMFIIYVNQKNIKKDSTKQSKLYFIDLAGSEKVGKTNVQGVQLQQAKSINKSLSSLGNVINALTSQKKEHIPYRDSKLTRLLQQSLGGNSKTTLIINSSMCDYNDKETLSTLRFGYRAKSIKNKPKVNEEKSVKELMILLEAANKTISELKAKLGGANIQSKDEETYNQQAQETISQEMQELKQQLQEYKRQDEQKEKQLKQMQMRIKNLLLEFNSQKQNHQRYEQSMTQMLRILKFNLNKLNKYMNRVYMDLQFWINNAVIEGTSKQNEEIKANLNVTFQDIVQYTSFYDTEVKQAFKSLEEEEHFEEQTYDVSKQDNLKQKRLKITLSQQNLSNSINEDFQVSCIEGEKKEDKSMNYSDKVSQEQSFTQIEALLESLETKQGHKLVIEEMSYNLKNLRRQNEDLNKEKEKALNENKGIAQKLEEQYAEKIMDLEERVEEYRHIINQKDKELTKYLKDIEKQRNVTLSQRIVSQRLKKIIEGNANLNSFYQIEEKARSLASQRQKMFNQIYRLRNQLDESELDCKQKEEHIQSLKQVMKELASSQYHQMTDKEIEKKYNSKVYGTEAPNVVVSVKGGGKKDEQNTPGKQRQSNLRKKVGNLPDKSQQNEGFLPYIKGFFN